jgi:hypothetical protein
MAGVTAIGLQVWPLNRVVTTATGVVLLPSKQQEQSCKIRIKKNTATKFIENGVSGEIIEVQE